MHVLVTGGAGYIGTHIIIELLADGHGVVVADNLANSNPEALKRVAKITGKDVPFYKVDCTQEQPLGEVFAKHKIDAVIHLAALKAVGESVRQPLDYYRNNIDSLLVLCRVMDEFKVRRLVFSSSAVIYGDPSELPLRETSQAGGLTNPYAQTKAMAEQILHDVAAADPTWQISILRYFNPIGAHPSGLIGEDPNGKPNNLVPYVTQVAVGKLEKVMVFGNDYDTPDGTGVRDYLHVVDLAQGHVAALDHLPRPGWVEAYNLATGKGTSVLEIIRAVETASGKTVPYEIAARRPGDIAACYADPSKASRELGWKTAKTVEEACADAWRWQQQNPSGYA